MLFASYQPLYRCLARDEWGAICRNFFGDTLELDRMNWRGTPNLNYVDAFGFNPVWCFPANNAQEFFAHSMLITPSRAEILFVFESNNFIRIDKIKHEHRLMHGDHSFSGLLNSDVDDMHSEFVAPVDVLSNALTGVVLPPRFSSCDDKPQLLTFTQDGYLEFSCDFLRLYGKEVAELMTRQEFELENMRFFFNLCLLCPWYRTILMEEQINCCDGFTHCSPLWSNALSLCKQFKMWSWDLSNAEEYDRIFRALQNCICNGRCPC